MTVFCRFVFVSVAHFTMLWTVMLSHFSRKHCFSCSFHIFFFYRFFFCFELLVFLLFKTEVTLKGRETNDGREKACGWRVLKRFAKYDDEERKNTFRSVRMKEMNTTHRAMQ